MDHHFRHHQRHQSSSGEMMGDALNSSGRHNLLIPRMQVIDVLKNLNVSGMY